MKHKDLRTNVFIVPREGGNIVVNDPEGEVIAVIGFEAGIHRLDRIGQYFPPECDFSPENGVIGQRSAERGIVIWQPEQFKTGANPDFQPIRLTDGEARMMGVIKGLQNKVKELDLRGKFMAEKLKPDPLIEDPDPEPESETKGKPGEAEGEPDAERNAAQ